jgi:hypothetical protein
MAMPRDTWSCGAQLNLKDETGNSYLLLGGAFYSTGSDNRTVWVSPYAEGGQRSRFSFANILLGPCGDLRYDQGTPDGWTRFPYVLNPSMGGLGLVAQNWPPSTVWPSDYQGVTTWVRLGATASQPQTELWQDVALVAANAADPTVWKAVTTNTNRQVYHRDSASPALRESLAAGGGSYYQSEGSSAVNVNALAGAGTGGLVVGDGTGTYSTTIVGGYTQPTPIHDAAAPGGSYYLGADHGGALCRKDAAGKVHVYAEAPPTP